MARLSAEIHRIPRLPAAATLPANRARSSRRVRPELVVGVLMVAFGVPRVGAQEVPVKYDAAETFAAADTIGSPTPSASVVLFRSPRIARHGSSFLELPPSADGDLVERLAAADDSVKSRQGRHMLVGMVIGTAAGAGLGYVAGKAWCNAHDYSGEGPPCEIGLAPLMALSTFAGLIAGGIIGAHAERVLPVPPPHHLTLGAIPHGARGMVMTVRLQ